MAEYTISQISASSYPLVLAEKRKPTNQWGDSTLLDEMQRQGFIKKKSFGETIEVPIDYQMNPSFEFLSIDTQAVSLAKTEVLSAASYSIGQASESVVWSKFDDARTPSENAKIAFVTALQENAIDTHDNKIEEAMFATTSGDVLGFQTLIPDSGQGSVGGISAVTETQWRNPTEAYLDDASDLEAQMGDLYNQIAKGSGSSMRPTLVVTGASPYALYESILTPQQRFSGATADGGFVHLKYKQVPIVFSQFGGTRIYMLTPKAIELDVSAEYWRHKSDTVELPNSHMFSYKIYSALQLVVKSKSRLGVLTQTAT